MSEIDIGQVAQVLGYNRKYVNDKLRKKPGFPPPVQNNSPRKRRWRLADILRYKQGPTEG